VSSTPEVERSDAASFELFARFLKDHGFFDTAALFDRANVLCRQKAELLEEIERQSEDVKKILQQAGRRQA
jgi:hypothetical protein